MMLHLGLSLRRPRVDRRRIIHGHPRTPEWGSVRECHLRAEGDLRGYVQLPGEVDPPDWWVVAEAHRACRPRRRRTARRSRRGGESDRDPRVECHDRDLFNERRRLVGCRAEHSPGCPADKCPGRLARQRRTGGEHDLSRAVLTREGDGGSHPKPCMAPCSPAWRGSSHQRLHAFDAESIAL